MNCIPILQWDGKRHEAPLFNLTDSTKIISIPESGLLSFIFSRDSSGLSEYTPVLTFHEEAASRPEEFILYFPFAKNSVGKENTLFYDNGTGTNVFCKVSPLPEEEKSVTTRDIVLFHSRKGSFSCAFSSFEKYLTFFRVDSEGVSLVWDLEGKTVPSGEALPLERFIADDTMEGQIFWDSVALLLKARYKVETNKPIPRGWSSWSCYYHHLTQAGINLEIENMRTTYGDSKLNLIQLDDGWQTGGSFDDFWTESQEAFPEGMKSTAQKTRDAGMDFGLWMAPGLLSSRSPLWEVKKSLLAGDVPSFDRYYNMDITREDVIKEICGHFIRLKEEYGVRYFKIDFLLRLLLRIENGIEKPIHYPELYAAEAYRNLVRRIRESVGPDCYLLACGAPIGEAIGVFDGIRASADIAWAGMPHEDHPGYWNIIRNNAHCVFYRNAWHRRLFHMDPDALLVRGYLTSHDDDLLSLSEDEARAWATVTAFSGGHILVNEELELLPENRKEMIRAVLPTPGLAARPKDFFEMPYVTEAYIPGKDAMLVGFFNWGDEPLDKILYPEDYLKGQILIVDAWKHELLGLNCNSMAFCLPPRSTRVLLLRCLPERGLLWREDSLYSGLGQANSGCHGIYLLPEGSDSGEPIANAYQLPLYRL